ncbi:hypothetical protein ASPSYDRAFT_78686 [Aspergillus sydowii CBS 593.65]|uniref:Major facilitator superfamily (MFS) profile domain-containing protein n=1 Tax=Aspergillus sydowii CBS 593.65 TaxID=1036612 RepID=A0A1L9TH37_9EURO|nr:uncharacterized protein ASPSYDRAFT_78686 [Aspergillus sydowii CBS 593.65]OJJ58691.1 hypothetical protein ASPSYDRAFT_78686 [Aspergillus sydowii CBS 593.65]
MDPEKSAASHDENISSAGPVHRKAQTGDKRTARDPHGFPLVPQPTEYKDDPLNWHPALKLSVVVQISFLALMGPLGAAAPNPAFVVMSEHFGLSVHEISYELMLFLLFGGIGPLGILPLANAYGRRPVYLLGNLLAAVTNIAAGYCNTWAGVMVTRVICATICDLYFTHQRGVYMGIYTVCMTNGACIAPILGGAVAETLGWRACFFIPGFVQLGSFVVTIFSLPETLYYTERTTTPAHREQTYLENLVFRRNNFHPGRPRLRDYTRPFEMLQYVAILFPALLYMTCFGYGSVLFALTGAKLFTEFYGFSTLQTGLMLSVPLLLGGIIGELCAGWVTDWLSNRHAQRNSGERLPEARLTAIWGTLLVPVGIVLEGVCLEYSSEIHWVGSAFGMGLAHMGLQIATTTIYAYTTDCYKLYSAEISPVLNIFRQVFSCLISFYALPLGESVGIQYAWLIFALIVAVLLIPVVMLRYYGRKWRDLPSQSSRTGNT